MSEIIMKFKSCFEENTFSRETLIFKTEEGERLGEVTLRQLSQREILEGKDQPIEMLLVKAIERWDFQETNGQPLEINLENLKRLTSAKKVGSEYAWGILDFLVQTFTRMNFVLQSEEKNSERQSP